MKKGILIVLLLAGIFASANFAEAAISAELFRKVCTTGKPHEVEALIKNGLNVNAKIGDEDWTVLMFFARHNPNPESIALLLKNGADVNAKGKNGSTALAASAAFNANPEVSLLLLKNGADINAKSANGSTALMYAAALNSNPEVVSLLLKNGSDVNAKDKDGVTVLMGAAWYNPNPKIVPLLLKNGANANVRDNKGNNAIAYAAQNDKLKNTEVLKQLQKVTVAAKTEPQKPNATASSPEPKKVSGNALPRVEGFEAVINFFNQAPPQLKNSNSQNVDMLVSYGKINEAAQYATQKMHDDLLGSLLGRIAAYDSQFKAIVTQAINAWNQGNSAQADKYLTQALNYDISSGVFILGDSVIDRTSGTNVTNIAPDLYKKVKAELSKAQNTIRNYANQQREAEERERARAIQAQIQEEERARQAKIQEEERARQAKAQEEERMRQAKKREEERIRQVQVQAQTQKTSLQGSVASTLDGLIDSGVIPLYVKDKGKFTLRDVHSNDSGVVRITGNNVRLRSQPNTEARVVANASETRFFAYIGEWINPKDEKWVAVLFDGAEGETRKADWVYGQYVEHLTNEQYAAILSASPASTEKTTGEMIVDAVIGEVVGFVTEKAVETVAEKAAGWAASAAYRWWTGETDDDREAFREAGFTPNSEAFGENVGGFVGDFAGEVYRWWNSEETSGDIPTD
ncbi:hypothetical protein FACS1894187_17190 [Synergistales bacterium]|nr:hypothetical protein FACS1894187_17190 [Synergistales bacterium]